jgi:regulator of protease activity HflC (stomatin/prohibitin superfamily)
MRTELKDLKNINRIKLSDVVPEQDIEDSPQIKKESDDAAAASSVNIEPVKQNSAEPPKEEQNKGDEGENAS